MLWATVLLAAKPALLFTGFIGRFRERVDPEYAGRMEKLGYQLAARDLRRVDFDFLRKFNVVVLYRHPPRGALEEAKVYKAKIPLLVRFVKEGGGLFIFGDLSYGSEENLNRLLREFGAELSADLRVWDGKAFRQENYLQIALAETGNIADHPATGGVDKIIFPLEEYPGAPNFALMKLGPGWEAIVKTEATGQVLRVKGGRRKVEREGELPVLAVRQFGEGRVALFPAHSVQYVHQGYHRIWEGLTMERGNGFRLLKAVFDWLAEPSLRSGKFGGYVQKEPLRPRRRPAPPPKGVASTDPYQRLLFGLGREFREEVRVEPRGWKVYKGVIGVYTKRSMGWGDVPDFCRKAKESGFNFLAFTDRFDMLTPEEWEDLVEKCRKETRGDFVAIPGIEYENPRGTKFFALNLPRWPDKAWLTEDGRFVKNQPGFYFGLGWPPVFLVLPKLAMVPPWFVKFYSGLEVYAYSHGDRPLGDVKDWYLICQRSDYNLIPISCHRIHSPQELERVKGHLTYILAPSPKEIAAGLKYFWYAQRRTFVSSGPIVKEWWIENGRAALRDEQWRALLEVESQSPLTKVIVWDGEEPFRIFRPLAKHFRAELVGYHDRQRALTLEAFDEAGGHAITGTLYVSDRRHSTYMCTDLQNTLNSTFDLDPETGELTYGTVLGPWVTGWDGGKIGLLVPERKLFPEGMDFAVKGFTVGFSHVIHAEEGEESAVARREITFGSGDCNILTSYFRTKLLPGSYPVPTELAESTCRLVAFTPKLYSYNIIIVEHEVRIKRDLTLPAREGPEVGLIHIGLPPNSFRKIAFLSPEGKKVVKDREGDVPVPEGFLSPGGYVASFPDFYGSVAVFALGQRSCFRIEGGFPKGGRIEIGLDLPGARLRRGQVLRATHLLVRGKFGEPDERDFDLIRDVYGLDGKPAYRAVAERGKVLEAGYVLRVKADRNVALLKISRADLPNPLPIVVEGLWNRWDAGLLDLDTGKFRRVGVYGDKGLLALDLSRPRRVAVGNVAICDDPEVFLSVFKERGRWILEAHNPSPVGKTVRVEVPRWVGAIPPFRGEVKVGGGRSVFIRPGG